ncbi:lantibiotic dehydratase family protein [Flavobacterium hercynium]|uniref:Lantibiotic dehydratase N-terminal domain-containing protein n=1 Tax=Flavobacterium hercynium TaxID=387094 RepID=A0A226HIP1_9FLAO|nr:lantibiotic dehydratase family protein [Flavobacterium hercynium]OXA93511.1 hypothetical protein B0A66_06685 [Flavobacterium hercynium]SMP32155.1 Lantibiotic dehydratase, C terminus [Flavobacterium hercynium]
MKEQYTISCFSKYVVRLPLFPLSLYLNISENYSRKGIISIYKNPFIKESLKLASPALVKELDKWVNIESTIDNDSKTRFEFTILKYLARISSRCTPFGLFTGSSIGEISHETNVVVAAKEYHTRFSQFDMEFWAALLHNISNQKTAILNLRYIPNSSIYEYGDFFRYVEYETIKTKREYKITALRKSDLLQKIRQETKSGLTVAEITSIIAKNTSEATAATQFVLQLIDFQFLVSELDPTVTGSNEYEVALEILKNIPVLNNEYLFLQKIKKQLQSLDHSLIPLEQQYEKIKSAINDKGFDYDEKHLFQTDLNISTSSNTLNSNIPKKVIQGLYFLNGIQQKKHAPLKDFIKVFAERYESREMPLMLVLDSEAGIGYPPNHDMNDSHELLEAYSFKSKKEKTEHQIWNSYELILEKKLQECLLNKGKKIVLSQTDFPDFNPDLKNIPATFSTIIEVYNNEKISVESSGNVSAAKLLGRFCNGNPEIYKLTEEIITKEKVFHSDKILAEIAHIPQTRTGNILRRPILRDYEITYLANSFDKNKNNIDLNDLFLSVKGDRILLKSKKLNKEIIPCLSNAHNFSSNSLPVYHFLCALQEQNLKPIFSFTWGVLESHYSYFPRVEHKNIILSKAKWIIANTDISSFLDLQNKVLYDSFSEWRINKAIPQLVNLVDFDNTLLLNLGTEAGIHLFLKSTKNSERIILEEFLFTEESVVKDINGQNFCNQFIVPFYKERV